MVRGVALAREVAGASAFDAWRGPEALPGTDVSEEATFAISFAGPPARTTTRSAPAGWAWAADAVVDPELRVRGIDGLRVADASIMPDIVSANTNTAAIVIGEKAADLVRNTSRAPLSPGNVRVGM